MNQGSGSRRRFLEKAGVAGALALAGCSGVFGGSGDGSAEDEEETESEGSAGLSVDGEWSSFQYNNRNHGTPAPGSVPDGPVSEQWSTNIEDSVGTGLA